jgi:MerR family transcriptional regulator, light-induced transcriptional regulator
MAGHRQDTGALMDWPQAEGFTTRAARRAYGFDAVASSGAPHDRGALARTIEAEIIPRLMLAHRMMPDKTRAEAAEASPPVEDAVATLAALALKEPVDVGVGYIEMLQMRGLGPEDLFLDVIAPAARQLGDMWVDDVVDFTDVTVGLTRLQQMLFEISPAFQSEAEHRVAARNALFLPTPGEQHALGLFMVQEFFRRAGWQVDGEYPRTNDELRAAVSVARYDIVGFSVSCEQFVEPLAAAIRIVRKYSRNRSVGIVVGGRLINDQPELVARVGADMTACDGKDAVQRLPALIGLTAQHT